MNEGLFGFPTRSGSTIIALQEFESSGHFLIPNGTDFLYIQAIGGGGGGGSGARKATNTTTFGGGSGASGGILIETIPLELLGVKAGQTIRIVIGRGGNPASSNAVDGADGSLAGSGGATEIYLPGSPFAFIRCAGGSGGSGGTTASGTSPTNKSIRINGLRLTGPSGVASSVTAQPAYSMNENDTSAFYQHPVGAGGGGISSVNTGQIGGRIDLQRFSSSVGFGNPNCAVTDGGTTTTITQGSSVNSSLAGASGEETFQRIGHVLYGGPLGWGYGGAGGGAGVTANAGSGGDGYRGGGGGGGGGSRNGFNGGAGGRGGNGYALLIAMR